jgi:hypothetical protein
MARKPGLSDHCVSTLTPPVHKTGKGREIMEIKVDISDVADDKGTTSVKIVVGKDGISIHPEGTAIVDGDYAPILIERFDGRIRLLYWPDINSDEPEIVDMSGALESARKPDVTET